MQKNNTVCTISSADILSNNRFVVVTNIFYRILSYAVNKSMHIVIYCSISIMLCDWNGETIYLYYKRYEHRSCFASGGEIERVKEGARAGTFE